MGGNVHDRTTQSNGGGLEVGGGPTCSCGGGGDSGEVRSQLRRALGRVGVNVWTCELQWVMAS